MNIKREYILTNGNVSREPVAAAKTFGFAEHRVLGLDEAERTVEAIVSTAALDSYQESVEPEAFMKRLPDRFKQNAPLIAGHVYHAEDGTPGKIGEWLEMGVRTVPGVGKALVGKARIFSGYDLADTCWKIISQSKSIAFSVGWLTHAWEMQDREVEGVTNRVRVYTDVELIEVSFVTVPANPQAVVQAALAKDRGPMLATLEQTDDTGLREQLVAIKEQLDEMSKAWDFEPNCKAHELMAAVAQRVAAEMVQRGPTQEAETKSPGKPGGRGVMQHLGM